MAEGSDQAAGLRTLFGRRPPRTVAFAPGEPGAGQSSAVAALADALARRGERVLRVDAGDAGPGAGRPALAGVEPIGWRPGGRRLPGGALPEGEHDWVLIDAPAAVWLDCPDLAAHCDVIVVTAPGERSALTGAYARIKQLANVAGRRPFQWLGLRLDDARAAAMHRRLASTALRFLGLGLGLAAALPDDEAVTRAQSLRRPLLDAYPRCPYAQAVTALAERASGWPRGTTSGGFADLCARHETRAAAAPTGPGPVYAG
jgi:MinD-like ATPase involved in chromosome partitioning or flagellar assembly